MAAVFILINCTTPAFTYFPYAMLQLHLDEITNGQESKNKAERLFGSVQPKKAVECQPPKWIPHGG